MTQWRSSQSLNDWVKLLRFIYGNRNSERDRFNLYAHLTEVVAGLYKSVRKGSDYTEVENFLAKTFAWFSALAHSLGFRDVEATVWIKYPGVCPYCLNPRCQCAPDGHFVLDPAALRNRMFELPDRNRPGRLLEWQRMFNDIYGTPARLLGTGPGESHSPKLTMLVGAARLFEEMGELAEAIRLEHNFPIALRTELADVFAWIMALANTLPQFKRDPQFNFEDSLWDRYPGKCNYCFRDECICLNVRVRPSLIASAGGEFSVTVDPLTNLGRKEVFERNFSECVANATTSEPLSLLLVDLDHFKQVNDDFGHPFGDQVLQSVARAFRKILASYSGSGYRWGGEEFAGLLANRSPEEARACAERIRTELSNGRIRTPGGGDHLQTASIGIVTFEGALGIPVPHVTRALFDAVDAAVYRAKAQGRDCIVLGEVPTELVPNE